MIHGENATMNSNRSLEESHPLDDFEGFKAAVEEITADVRETARELELEVEPEDTAELLQPPGQT